MQVQGRWKCTCFSFSHGHCKCNHYESEREEGEEEETGYCDYDSVKIDCALVQGTHKAFENGRKRKAKAKRNSGKTNRREYESPTWNCASVIGGMRMRIPLINGLIFLLFGFLLELISILYQRNHREMPPLPWHRIEVKLTQAQGS